MSELCNDDERKVLNALNSEERQALSVLLSEWVGDVGTLVECVQLVKLMVAKNENVLRPHETCPLTMEQVLSVREKLAPLDL